MLATLIALILWFAGIAFTLWFIRTYFPNLAPIVFAVIVAAITILIARGLHTWLCSWLCGMGG